MAYAPGPYLSAGLATIESAVLAARACSWAALSNPERVAELPRKIEALMDVIHNLPLLLQNWEICDLELLREDLSRFDQRWGVADGLSLRAVFDETVAQAIHRDPPAP
jgi:hypothetical protein